MDLRIVDDPAEVLAEMLAEAAAAGAQIVMTGGSTPRKAYGLAARDQVAGFDGRWLARDGLVLTAIAVQPAVLTAGRMAARAAGQVETAQVETAQVAAGQP